MGQPDVIERTAARWADADQFRGWVIDGPSEDRIWLSYRPPNSVAIRDGVKIHVSTARSSAGDLLDCVMPLLAEAGVPFKHVRSLDRLALLASGRLGWTQVGKFLTVYPGSAAEAKTLAGALHSRTRHLRGPRILHDTQLHPGSLVHMRYGAFTERWLQLPVGRLVLARHGEHGDEEDNRESDRAPSEVLLRRRYALTRRLHTGFKGDTWLAFDVTKPSAELLVVKEAHAYFMEAQDGTDACDRLLWEAEVLRALASSGRTPLLVDVWRERDKAVLVCELVQGPTLLHVIQNLKRCGPRPPTRLLLRWATQLCDAVEAVHRAGFVLGDIKPANIIVTDHGFKFVDLELSGQPTDSPLPGIGTDGYVSPQQASPRHGRAFTDDIYSLGATLLATALLTDASDLPDVQAAALFEVNRDPANAALRAIVSCLDPEPERRLPDIAELRAALVAVTQPRRLDTTSDRPPYLELARSIGDRLIESSMQTGRHMHWESQHPIASGQPMRDLYVGTSGSALFLSALFDATGEGTYLDAALAAGRWLAESKPSYHRKTPMPGLYFGEAGVGWLYAKLYAQTMDRQWALRADEVARSVRDWPSHSPDLLTGDAGVGLLQLGVWHVTGDGSALQGANDVMERLKGSPLREGNEWRIPPGHEGLSGHAYVGISHGTAGIAYFAAELARLQKSDDALQLTEELTYWLINQRRVCPQDDRGTVWPTFSTESEAPAMNHWCHGGAGVARLLAAASRVLPESELRIVGDQLGFGVAATAAWSGSTQCHGLPGSIEALVDVWRITQDPNWISRADDLARNLLIYRSDDGWKGEVRGVPTPDLMVGEAGVGAALLRLDEPRRPHIVSIDFLAGPEGRTRA